MSGYSSPETRIRRSARAKRLRLVVKPGLIELVAPLAASEVQLSAFLNQHRGWAERKCREMAGRLKAASGPGFFDDGATLPWRGREIPLLVTEGSGRRVRVSIDDAARVVLPGGLGNEREPVLKHALFLWIRTWLHREVATLAAHHAPRHGLHPRGVRIKRMTSRWGSCGPHWDININWLLAFTPEPVLEYVVVHELCHIRERNHSAAFWSLVAEHMPQYQRERSWLKDHGAALIQRFSGP